MSSDIFEFSHTVEINLTAKGRSKSWLYREYLRRGGTLTRATFYRRFGEGAAWQLEEAALVAEILQISIYGASEHLPKDIGVMVAQFATLDPKVQESVALLISELFRG